MSVKSIFKIYIFLFTVLSFCQNPCSLSGKINSEKVALPEITVELKINNISKFAISNSKGEYKFLKLNISNTDSISISIKKTGFKIFNQKITLKKVDEVFDIKLQSESIELKEITVQNEKIKNTARKSIYKINQKDFIANTKATNVLATIPSINMSDDAITVEGNLSAIVFIDGVQSFDGELKTIDATSISKIEVLSNPSASFGTDNIRAIINIITKKNKKEFIKGAIGSTIGLRNNFSTNTPYFSFKKGKVIFNTYLDYKNYDQTINYNINRNQNNYLFRQDNENISKGSQIYFSNKLNLVVFKKWDLTFLGGIYGYKFVNDSKGYFYSNTIDNKVDYIKNGEDSNKEWNLNSIFRNRISDSKTLFFKAKYSNYEDKSYSNLNTNSKTTNFILDSKNKEFSTSIDFENTSTLIFKKETELYTGFKFINRNFDFANTSFSINQNIINLYSELDTSWNDKFETEIAFTFENARNYNKNINTSYNLFLPTVNSVYHFEKKIDLKLGYSRKIIRPDADELNNDILIIYPGIAKQGNYDLEPEIRNYSFLTFIKSYKKDNISLKIYNETINNAIVETYKNQEDLVIKTHNNAAKFNALGFNLGFNTSLFKKINLNINSGLEYDSFEDKNPNSLIKSNKGISYKGNLNANTKLFKDKFSLSFSARNNNPTYSLLSKKITYPFFDFTIITNVLKNRINLNLYVKDLINRSSNSIESSNYENFNQDIIIKNKNYNVLLTITYNFGKKFNDTIEDNSIENNDVRK